MLYVVMFFFWSSGLLVLVLRSFACFFVLFFVFVESELWQCDVLLLRQQGIPDPVERKSSGGLR